MEKETTVKTDNKKPKVYKITVEFSRKDRRKISFDKNLVTGAEIKSEAGAEVKTDLGKRIENQIQYIPDSLEIEIKNGDRFIIKPFGTIS